MNALILTLAMFGQGEGLEAPKAPPTHDPSEQAWRGMYTANVHVRYHATKAWCWKVVDFVVMGIISILAVFLLVCWIDPTLSAVWEKLRIWGLVTILALPLFMYIHPWSDRRAKHTQSRDCWEELSAKYEKIWNGIEYYKDPQKRLDDLLSERIVIEKDEPPGPDTAFLGECQEAESRSWGLGKSTSNE